MDRVAEGEKVGRGKKGEIGLPYVLYSLLNTSSVRMKRRSRLRRARCRCRSCWLDCRRWGGEGWLGYRIAVEINISQV